MNTCTFFICYLFLDDVLSHYVSLMSCFRLRRDVEKRISSNAYESRPHDLEQDVTATSESCSWVADEKACSSDNQNSSVMKGGELHKR